VYVVSIHKHRCLDMSGFTLIELVIVISTLGVLAAVAIPKFANLTQSSKISASKQEMLSIKEAIVGNPAAVAGGEYIDRGFEGDVGFIPSALSDLAGKPDSVNSYDQFTRLGWNGPYIDADRGEYLKDSWGNYYSYEPGNRRVISTGGGNDSIIVSF
jgi:prepilin-type N-terminal cleavage/methylation domain-containing protein